MMTSVHQTVVQTSSRQISHPAIRIAE